MSKLDAAVNDQSLDRWKKRYLCTLGEAGGWCDGVNARRCPKVILFGKREQDGAGCYLSV